MPKTPADRHVALDPRKAINQYIACWCVIPFTREWTRKEEQKVLLWKEGQHKPQVSDSYIMICSWLSAGLGSESDPKEDWHENWKKKSSLALHLTLIKTRVHEEANYKLYKERTNWKRMMRTETIPSRTEMSSKTSECETAVRTSRNFVSKGDITPVHDKSFCNSCQLSLGHCARPSDEFLQSTIGNQNFTNKSSYVLKNETPDCV
jgi:hypothetical protein